MSAGVVPVAGNWLRVQRNNNSEVFGDAVQNEARHPEVIGQLDAVQWTNLQRSHIVTAQLDR